MESLQGLWACCAEKRVDLKPLNDRLRHYIAIACTYWFVRTSLSANMVTVVFIVFGCLGGALLAFPGYWVPLLGALCLQIHAVLDIADGQVARFRRLSKKLPGNPKVGMYLDLVGHSMTDTMIFLGLTLNFHDSIIQSKWAIAVGFLGAGARLLYLLIGCIILYVVATESPKESPLRAAELPNLKELRRDLTSTQTTSGRRARIKSLAVKAFFFVRWPHYLDFILIMSLFGWLPWSLPFLAAGTVLFAAGSIYALAHHEIVRSPPGGESVVPLN